MIEDIQKYFKTLEIVNDISDKTRSYGIDPSDISTVFKLYTNNRQIKLFKSITGCAGYIVQNNLHIVHIEKCKGTEMPLMSLVACASLDNEIQKSVYELLKGFANKKAPEFKEQLENAILNRDITFKQYNELKKENN